MPIVSLEIDREAREIFCGLARVVHLLAVLRGQLAPVSWPRPLETRDMRSDSYRTDRRARRPWRRQQVPDQHGRVAHHVVEHAATLQLAAPEPGSVRPAVLLGCPS